MTGCAEDRQRSDNIASEVCGDGAILGFLKGALFEDTHEGGEMSHEQNTERRRTDKIED
jgi:hypothetical protein